MKYKLAKVKNGGKKRLGRGMGSGKGGHTSSRGMKGQKSRTSNHILFEGTKMKKSYIKRLPFLRGRGKNKPVSEVINIKTSDLEQFSNGTLVNNEALVKAGLVKSSKAHMPVKVLSGGKLTKSLKVQLLTTKGAEKIITKAKGEVVGQELPESK